ncbi:IclR family transcriptional regulator [Altererythrobacter lutimaris]|uniref:IclR family transcriptional regulator n=1 Tax=Altererythrobacter lutimaris TaxID=2743979 RepID=A0A850HBI9_9SPHN|nr:IclR family transcriptional regulator [Altererythrobacter lutimaris]NVE94371.1 IclR family transcriptional regulator [Altererythrobacter lutimaris]
MMMKEKQYSAPALEKGISIVERLAVADRPLTMNEIADQLERSKHQIYRMLVSLETLGWLARTSDEKFFLTNRLFDLAMRVPPRRNLHEAALPLMRELSERLNQSCHLAVVSGSDIVVVARMESPGLLGFAVRVGHRMPIVESASGPVILANVSNSVQKSIRSMISGSDNSKAVSERFETFVKQVVDAGILVRESPLIPGVTDISAPVFENSSEQGVAALTIPFLKGGAAATSIEEAVDALKLTASGISEKLRLG